MLVGSTVVGSGSVASMATDSLNIHSTDQEHTVPLYTSFPNCGRLSTIYCIHLGQAKPVLQEGWSFTRTVSQRGLAPGHPLLCSDLDVRLWAVTSRWTLILFFSY